jgi:CO/xanthine dehydrogenase Mo-binding subunit
VRVVGRSVPRREGLDKARGEARYVDDLRLPGMLHGRTVRTTIAHGEIASVHLAFDRKGFTVVDHRDIPGRNVVALIEDDQPYLVEREVRHAEEPVLLLAHEDRDALRAAEVRLEYRPEAPVLDPRRSTRVFKEIAIEKGDLARGLAEADLVVEGEYRTGRQEHVYIEPNGFIAVRRRGVTTRSLSAPTTSTRRWWASSGSPTRRSASSRRKPAAASAARRTTPRSSPATRPSWP